MTTETLKTEGVTTEREKEKNRYLGLYKLSRAARKLIVGGLLALSSWGMFGCGFERPSQKELAARQEAQELIKRGRETMQRIDELSKEIKKIERIRKSESPAEVSWLEGKDGYLSAEEFKEIIFKTFPKSWIETVRSIYPTSEEDFLGREYGQQLAEEKSLATCIGTKDRSIIVFRPPMLNHSLEYLTGRTSPHELAHAYHNSLDDHEFGILKSKISSRIRAQNRYQSSYVESIKNDKEGFERKVYEYWAEISAQYFNNPWSLHVNDMYLVHNEVMKDNPKFDWLTAKNLRNQLVTKAMAKPNPVIAQQEQYSTQQ